MAKAKSKAKPRARSNLTNRIEALEHLVVQQGQKIDKLLTIALQLRSGADPTKVDDLQREVVRARHRSAEILSLMQGVVDQQKRLSSPG